MEHARPVSSSRARRPMLLALVFGIFLVLIGVTASALVAVVSDHLAYTGLTAVVSRDRDLVEFFVEGNLERPDLAADELGIARRSALRAQLDSLASDDGIVAIAIRNPEGTILVAGGPAADRLVDGASKPAVARALEGRPQANLVESATGEQDGILEEHMPILSDDTVLGAVSLHRDAGAILAGLDEARRDVMLVTLAAAFVLAVILYFVFRAAQARITRQQDQLLEATRRDALTGMLNHGAIVAQLAEAVDASRETRRQIAVALIDIDNFRLFNDTHGHEAGDAVLLAVAGLVEDLGTGGDSVARYGPDEFIVVFADRPLGDALQVTRGLQAAMRDVGFRFGTSEELPVTVSIGLAAFPEHAASVTDLLSEASVALGEAKNSGGDSVVVAHRADKEKVAAGSFDVLQGLVIAVDTKDRYTKKHSEDVARYAVFLARELGLDDEMLDVIHIAGLLHDVGKIGIPDAILRKPGKLTADEYKVFQQHVALGDSIVRDVPHVDLVRAGIKHHHERWDGQGYLEGLEGDAIPMIGRVLAVADAFSAMTTTRPYRKALSIEEALKRLGDAAGTQLQEGLVKSFIDGIETAADPPLPGEKSTGVWRPTRQVA
jgi:diguanylate cyclase (GGDEF)-like protein